MDFDLSAQARAARGELELALDLAGR